MSRFGPPDLAAPDTLARAVRRIVPATSLRRRSDRPATVAGLFVFAGDSAHGERGQLRMVLGTQQGLEGHDPLPDPRVHALLRTARGLWIGTEGGLALVSR